MILSVILKILRFYKLRFFYRYDFQSHDNYVCIYKTHSFNKNSEENFYSSERKYRLFTYHMLPISRVIRCDHIFPDEIVRFNISINRKWSCKWWLEGLQDFTTIPVLLFVWSSSDLFVHCFLLLWNGMACTLLLQEILGRGRGRGRGGGRESYPTYARF